MKKRMRFIASAMLMVGVLVSGPSVSQANVIITDILVTVGTGTYSQVGGTGVTQVWSFPVSLAVGETLLLSQFTSGLVGASPGYNFDASDNCIGGGCASPTITITTSGDLVGSFSYTDGSGVLSLQNADLQVPPKNESQEYLGTTGGSAFLDVDVGYADDAHNFPCPDGGANCRPDPFSATFVQANAVGVVPNLCAKDGLTSCFDAGVILITNNFRVVVPEPATLLLLGAGLLGLTAWGRGRKRGEN